MADLIDTVEVVREVAAELGSGGPGVPRRPRPVWLTRLLRTTEARDEIAALYASFAERFDTRDPREATAPLEKLR